MAETRRKRSNIDGQEEMVAALWEFAYAVCALKGEHAFRSRGNAIDGEELKLIEAAMKRISNGYGYRIVEIQ